MSTVLDICKTVGIARLKAVLGVGGSAISNAISAGLFPAKWYVLVRSECEAVGIACDTHLFAFAAPKESKAILEAENPQNGEAA